MNLFDMGGKVAVVTGSSRGIGFATATRMAEMGAKVTISSRKAEACEKAVARIREAGGEAIAVPCDVADKAQLQRLVDDTLEKWGRIDVLVCNAAINPYFGPLAKITDEAFDRIMSVNVRSALWLCNMVLPQMAERRDGAIVMVSSVTGIKGNGLLGAYGLSKAADFQLARNLAVEWGEHNIRVNCVAPSVIRTAFSRVLYEDPERHAAVIKGYPLRRIGEPDDVAGAIIFLASPAGAFVTGQVLAVDGGATIGWGGG